MTPITFPLKMQDRGERVTDLQDGLRFILGEGMLFPTEAERLAWMNRLSTERAESRFGPNTRRVVGSFQEDRQLESSGVVDEPTATALNTLLSELGLLDSLDGRKVTRLAGRLRADSGALLEGVTLKFFRRGFGGRAILLGEVVTGPGGAYALALELSDGTALLDVRAVAADGTEVSLVDPGRRIAAAEPLDLTAPTDRLPRMEPEFSRLTTGLRPHLNGSSLADAREDTDQRDLSVLHENTGWDARLIALAALAEQNAEQIGVSPVILYALGRVGIPTDPNQLARVSLKGLGHALNKAVKAGVVSLDEQQIMEAQAALDRFGRRRRRQLAMAGSVSSYGAMLSASGLTVEQQDGFDEIYAAHTGDAVSLWQEVAQAGLPADQLELTAQLGVLTLNNARLTESLRARTSISARLGETLIAEKLYQPASWEARLRSLANDDDRELARMIPPSYEEETVDERLQAYAADMAHAVRRSYPTAVISDQVQSGRLPLGTTEPNLAAELATVLDRAAGHGFVLGQQPLDRFLSEQHDELFAGIPAQRVPPVTAELKTLYRQAQITASDEGLAVLQRNGLRSASLISAMPQREFLARYGDEFPSQVEAAVTWQRAQQVSAVTLNLVTMFKQIHSSLLFQVMHLPEALVRSAQQELVRQFPTLESLFGSLDFCECSHCRSVLSPAAYLVDLLKFLDPPPGSPSPYQALIERRPDLPHLPLTCENTNTALPYIDAVNEILEFFVAHDALAPQAMHDTGGAATADLIAEPQHVLPAAYEILRQARYPLTAPFDVWLATVRAFTNYFEVPFWRILEALRPTDELHATGGAGYGRASVAYERLGFSSAEMAILTAEDPLADWPELFGYDTTDDTTAKGELALARTLARKLGVNYHELVALLRTRFVNPLASLVLVDDAGHGDDCGWETMTLQRDDGSAVLEIDFLLLNYFVRVWRRLGWSILETDQSLVTFLPTNPNPRTGAAIGPAMATALLGVARLQHLADLLGVTAKRRDLNALWAPLTDSRYEELFLTGTRETRDPVFEGEPGSYLTDPGILLAEHREGVQAALQLTADELRQILADAGLPLATAPLTVATVSLLYRYGMLARLLKLSVADLLVLKELSGLDPFTPLAAGPVTLAVDDHPYEQTIEFVKAVQAVADSRLSIPELDFLLRHRFDPVGPHRDAAQPPLELVQAIAREIARIRAEYADPADPITFTDELLARMLALVCDPGVVTAFLDAWTDTTSLPDEIFDEHLRRHVISGVGEVGFLTESDREVLFTPPEDQAEDTNRRARLAATFLPYLRDQLIRRTVTEVVAADRNVDPGLVESLLSNSRLIAALEHAERPLLDGYLSVGESGLTTVEDGGEVEVGGYLEVPASGGYRFTVHCQEAGTRVALRFDHLNEPSLSATVTAEDLAPSTELELSAGVPYGFTLTHSAGAHVEMRLRSQHLPTTPVTGLVTVPRAAVERLHRTHLLLTKALRLVEVMQLTEGELRHLLTNRDDFGRLDLGTLPTQAGAGDGPQARERFAWLRRLLDYARLRADLVADPTDLIAVFAHARRRVFEDEDPDEVASQVIVDVTTRFAAITRREPETVREAAELLGMSATITGNQVMFTDATQAHGLERLWQVLSLAVRLGVDPDALRRWATPTPDHNVAQDMRNTVKAKYATEQWRRVAQPIFDQLRRQRRDALVAEVLRKTGYERAEQLFEHFLVDPMTEPVVQTSRIRLAISSVQTFIQRCLLNLEKDVASSAINAEHWAWMQRYRVWEANRKIFLWPENWLEPEFRDDKSHLFSELESALLESELDEDAVESALFGYLSGLEDIARLDVRATYWEERLGGNVLHVVARTPTAPHAYYYRTWSHRSWTPWGPVSIDIEGDHLVIAVWQGRLHLFWVTFLLQTEQELLQTEQKLLQTEQELLQTEQELFLTSVPTDTPVAELSLEEVQNVAPRRTVQPQLFWSSHHQGAWSKPALAEPEETREQVVNGVFNPRAIFIWARAESPRTISITLRGPNMQQRFRLTSRHAPPVATTPTEFPFSRYRTIDDQPLTALGPGRWRGQKPTFAVEVMGISSVDGEFVELWNPIMPILRKTPHPYWLVLPAYRGRPLPPGAPPEWFSLVRVDYPFFFVDQEHTFFVEPDWAETKVWHGPQGLGERLAMVKFDEPEYWEGVHVVAASPRPAVHGVARERSDPVLLEPAARDIITGREAVAFFAGRPVGNAGGLTVDYGHFPHVNGREITAMSTENVAWLPPSYHAQPTHQGSSGVGVFTSTRWLRYRFNTFFHPFVTELVEQLVAGGVRGLLYADIAQPPLHTELFTGMRYDPEDSLVVNDERHRNPVADLDFLHSGAYAVYNWEVFYHVPFTIAIHLSREQRFAEAQRWLHYIFDPTDDSAAESPDRFWKVGPFRDGNPTLIEKVLTNLSTREDPKLFEETVNNIGKWRDTPLRPHAVARYRPTSYMLKTVMAYLDNLIAWGDALFRQDTGESINEATQLYVLAANILGTRPQEVPRKGHPQPRTYANLRGNLDEFGNTLEEVEVNLPFDVIDRVAPAVDAGAMGAVRSVATSLYFCIPRNDKLLGYWDTVADRLFKIRNSLDIHGVFRQLPLFDPPIDPAMLAKAAAAGLDVGAIVAGLGQPLPLVRFWVLVQKASEICQEVKSLGAQLLPTIEKQDAERMAALRAHHEKVVLELAEVVRYGQWQEAIKVREGLEKSFEGAVARLNYYERLLEGPETPTLLLSLDELDMEALERLRFSAREPELTHRPVEIDIAEDLREDLRGVLLSEYEAKELQNLYKASSEQILASYSQAFGALMAIIPNFSLEIEPFGIGGSISFGGSNLGAAFSAGGAVFNALAADFAYKASESARIGTYQRRQQEWAHQSNVIASEITQIYKQWRAAQIREALAAREWRNHQQQIRHAEEIEQFLTDAKTGKTTNADFYAWLRREVRGLYSKCFDFAFTVAKNAERALQHELGEPQQTFLHGGYQAGKEGLLAGERLYLDIKRMEMAYHELNRREYELTSNISLRQLDPVALLTLRATGRCLFELPEEWFDLECPGHYFRRLQSVALSIPCVVGPYTSVHATLTLERSVVRISPALRGGDGYAPDPSRDEDDRFSHHLGGVQTVVTSSGNQDSGLFEVNLRDERYLPFEKSGAIGRWRLTLPAELPLFDRNTIADVVLHLRYTAREGGSPLRSAAQAHVKNLAANANAAGSVLLLSLRHEFPTEWARFTATALDGQTPEAPLTIVLKEKHYPFWARAIAPVGLRNVGLFAEPGPNTAATINLATARAEEPDRTEHSLVTDNSLGGLRVGEFTQPLPDALGEFTWYLNDNSLRDLWLALTWGSQ